jgi:exopolysaccharide biosynthesis polyprenyl glycosylphosphotransferase
LSTLSVAPSQTGAATTTRASTSLWSRQRSHIRLLMVIDTAAVGFAVGAAYLTRFQGEPALGASVPYALIAPALVLVWLAALRVLRCYDHQVVGYGAEEYRRVLSATFRLAATVAIGLYLLDIGVSRGFLAISFVAGATSLTLGRFLANKHLHRARARGEGWSRRVLVVGDPAHLYELMLQLRRGPYTGYEVVGACIPDALRAPQPQQFGEVPVVGSFRSIPESAQRVGADTVAVTASGELTASRLRRLGWELEGTDIDLVVTPALTDVAGPRIHTRPVAGLPMIHVAAPKFEGGPKVVKALVDRLAALITLLLLAPLFLVIAVAIRIDSKGSVFFKQVRVGRGGKEFHLYKFRTMVANAHAMRDILADRNETDGLLFKMRDDPRVTRVGRWLRMWSLDELPQLINVLLGQMSLVGPRPPLPEEVAQYDRDVARRLLVTPGMTGLWQVSGRSDLSWMDGIRLDLYYVENWSLTTDLVILWKTVGAVLRRQGAY